MEQPELRVGMHVIYVDPVARQHDAIVTAVWGPTCINVVFVSNDENRTDSWGRQIERQTSLGHRSGTPAHGQYFMMPGDTPNPIAQPIAR
jgi:hypothetical protein